MNTARGTAPTGIPHDVNPTAGSEYVETDKERCTANAIDKEVSAEHVQGTPEVAPHAITTMVNYMETAGIETERQGRSIRSLRGSGEDIWKTTRRCIKHFLVKRF